MRKHTEIRLGQRKWLKPKNIWKKWLKKLLRPPGNADNRHRL